MRKLFPHLLFYIFSFFSFNDSFCQELDLSRRFYIASGAYQNKKLVTGLTIIEDSLGNCSAQIELLIEWKLIDSTTYTCSADKQDTSFYFVRNNQKINAIRIYDSISGLQILIEKPIRRVYYNELRQEIIYWDSDEASVILPNRFWKYWKKEVLFHEK